jgi:hypothetical protein
VVWIHLAQDKYQWRALVKILNDDDSPVEQVQVAQDTVSEF